MDPGLVDSGIKSELTVDGLEESGCEAKVGYVGLWPLSASTCVAVTTVSSVAAVLVDVKVENTEGA